MQYFKVTLLFLVVCFAASAQKISHPVELDGIKWVKIKSKSSVKIIGNTGNKLILKVDSSAAAPKEAKGLKLIGTVIANTDIGFYINKEGDVLWLENVRRNGYGDAEIHLPSTINISVIEEGYDDVSVTDMLGEIEVTSKNGGRTKIKKITGPVTINSEYGDIEVAFAKVNQKAPINIISSNGNIDVSLPGNTPVTLGVNTFGGEFYTDFDIQMLNKEEAFKKMAGINLEAKINNGGVLMHLQTATGDVFLRKK